MSTSNPKQSNPFDASASMRGNIYQSYYALYLMLKELDNSKEHGFIKNLSVKIEGLDDIELAENGRVYKLIQTKHLKLENSLIDSSEEFWKTIRIWSELILNQKISIDIDNVIFSFVTTTNSSAGHVLDLLNNKKINEALEKMKKFITLRLPKIKTKVEEANKKNKKLSLTDNEKAFISFEKLAEDQKVKLLKAIEVKLLSPNLEEIQEKIKDQLITHVSSERMNSFAEELKGWWQDKNTNFSETTLSEINRKIQDLSHKYYNSNLPDIYENKDIELPSNDDTHNFVKQLKKLQFTDEIELARQDYYKTIKQRSEWENNIGCISPNDIVEYEQRLIKEGWCRKQKSVCDDFKFQNDIDNIESIVDEKILQTIGRNIYRQTQNESIPFKNITAKYFINGSYHILADGEPPKIYWHPKFLQFLESENQKC